MHGMKVVAAFHEPECGAGFPACRFTGLSSPVDEKRATRKSPEPAGSKACATSQSRFMVPMLFMGSSEDWPNCFANARLTPDG